MWQSIRIKSKRRSRNVSSEAWPSVATLTRQASAVSTASA
jgi:hypothetical protein